MPTEPPLTNFFVWNSLSPVAVLLTAEAASRSGSRISGQLGQTFLRRLRFSWRKVSSCYARAVASALALKKGSNSLSGLPP